MVRFGRLSRSDAGRAERYCSNQANQRAGEGKEPIVVLVNFVFISIAFFLISFSCFGLL